MSTSKWKPYPEYQVTPIEWNTRIPKKWKTVPLRYLCKIKTGEKDLIDRNPNGEYPFFVRSPKVERISTYSYDGEGILTAGDGNIGDIFHYVNGKFDYHQRVYLFHEFDGILARFLYYFLKANLKKVVLAMSAKSTVDSIRLPMLSSFPVSMPSINEQRLITNFIQIKEEKITSLIQNLFTILESLQEKRSGLITQAVTKGLNPNVEMKDSGIDWIGKVPEHWDIMKLKYLCETTKGKAFKSFEFSDSGSKIIRASDLKNNTVKFGDVYISEETASENINVKLHQGDILVSTVGSKPEVRNSAVGQVAKLPKELEGSFLNQNTVRLEAFESQISPEYLFNLLRNDLVRRFFDIHAHGTANQASLSLADILSFSFGMPPLIEQNEICKYISQNIQRIDSMSASINQQIEALNEYRIAMISAAVTGKIDIRESV